MHGQKDSNTVVDKMMKNMDEAMKKMADIEKDETLTQDQKDEIIKNQYKSFERYQDLMTGIIQSMQKMAAKKEKISKYHMSECIRKHKSFALNALGIDESQKIEYITDDMYGVIRDVLDETDPYKKSRLSKLYNVAIKDTFNSYKGHIFDIIEKTEDQDTVVDQVEEFYGAYFGMIISSVTNKYNKEIEMLEENRRKSEEEAAKKMAETLDPIVPTADEAISKSEVSEVENAHSN